ncbi:serine hydrolase [Nonomuraea sp. NPDC050540]|uniref:serine hydrolase n=1 Tax=Nonomuraea sp. NPDC050540 TaxID=3364367 RepID=UPI003790FC8D
MNVQGTVEAGFEGVREEFVRVASADGAQLAVYAHGRRVVDLWTGVTGASIQELYEQRVRAPYELDFNLGLPEAQEPRYDPVRPAERQPELHPRGLMAVAFNVPTDLVAFANTRETRALGSSSAGSVGNARGLAGMYAAAIGVLDRWPALLAPETVAEFSRVHAEGGDLVTGESRPFGLGFVPMAARYPFADRRAFGHSGAVGALSFADPGRGLAYAYTRRRFSPAGGAWGAPENDALVTALYNATT